MRNAITLIGLLAMFASFTSTGCSGPAANSDAAHAKTSNGTASLTSLESAGDNADFGGYWYQGKAEINTYQLSQARYGEMRQGESVLIFVTEDFSKSKHVKLDYPNRDSKDAVPIIKLNFTKQFNTGIYPYNMMWSSFTPVENDKLVLPSTLKLTTSSQEWCGHTFSQLNLREGGYESELRSYFESEGDQEVKLGKHLLEDEIWTQIRLNPENLPTGKRMLIPSGFAARLLHFDLKATEAELKLEKHPENKANMLYTVNYPGMERSLKIEFQQQFPHTIVGWEETYKDGFGANARPLTTKARIMEQRLLPYWNLNSNEDSPLRDELGLKR